MTPSLKAYSYIRMSTDLQLKGDSRRRQLEKSTNYAARHGLELVDARRLEDIGVSAFRGANVRDGALGRFLEAAKQGLVEPGSYLLVESLDRISRQEILKSLRLFSEIIEAGVTLVTLDDERVYRHEGLDFYDLMYSLTVLSRAHEESQTKSNRLSAAWKSKRDRAARQPMTKMCPAWLKLSDDRSRYLVIQDRANIVQDIYSLSANGVGIYSIAKGLNERRVDTFNTSDGWHASYIAKILNNRAVFGEFQPHTTQGGGKRRPDGPPIPEYYPAIVEKAVFFKAQAGRAGRMETGRGRKGRFNSNMFSGIARCAYCGSSLKYENKGQGPKGGQYLVCNRGTRHVACQAIRWRYDHFERSFLTFIRELDLEAILANPRELNEAQQLENEIAALEGEKSDIASLIANLFEVLRQTGDVQLVADEITARKDALENLEQQVQAKRTELEASNSRRLAYLESRENLRDLVAQVQSQQNDQDYETRARVSGKLRDIVETVLVAPDGKQPIIQRYIDELTAEDAEVDGGEDTFAGDIAFFTEVLKRPSESRPYFAVGFKDGSVRAVAPNPDDSSQYDQHLLSRPSDDGYLMTPAGNAQLLDPAFLDSWWENPPEMDGPTG